MSDVPARENEDGSQSVARVRLTPELRVAILSAWVEAGKPAGGYKYEAFLEAQSAWHGISTAGVRRVIADEANAAMFAMRAQMATPSEAMAELMGASRVRIIQTCLEGMEAIRRKPIIDDGKVLKDEKGNIQYTEQPLYAERTQAARLLTQIIGGFAPAQVEVTHKSDVGELSDDELTKRARALAAELVSLTGGQTSRTAVRAGEAKPRAEETEGSRGLVLLADGVHGDPGRAGSAEPVQAVPEAAVLPTRRKLRPAGSREQDRKKQDDDGVLADRG